MRHPARHLPERTEAWPAGRPVLLRHVLGRRTWCALPVTVLCDDGRHVVVRIRAGTAWLAAFGPRGRRAHSWQRPWRLAATRWHGHDMTYLVEWGRWYATAAISDPRTGLICRWYVNCQDPLRRRPWGFDTMDRELDIELSADDARPRWKDRDRFSRLARSGLLPTSSRRLMLTHAREARGRIADPGCRARLRHWAAAPGRSGRGDPVPDLAVLLATLPLPPDLRRPHRGDPPRTGVGLP
jgi:hypothetical protein